MDAPADLAAEYRVHSLTPRHHFISMSAAQALPEQVQLAVTTAAELLAETAATRALVAEQPIFVPPPHLPTAL